MTSCLENCAALAPCHKHPNVIYAGKYRRNSEEEKANWVCKGCDKYENCGENDWSKHLAHLRLASSRISRLVMRARQ